MGCELGHSPDTTHVLSGELGKWAHSPDTAHVLSGRFSR
jgi:hypothetical protein